MNQEPYFVIARDNHHELAEAVRAAIASGAGKPLGHLTLDDARHKVVQLMVMEEHAQKD